MFWNVTLFVVFSEDECTSGVRLTKANVQLTHGRIHCYTIKYPVLIQL
uniref:Uncharacterized protein n=1 Tax=Anguilla anguilla TaxID=7936 RepID=A0A0E9WQG7_ANGAN